MSFEITDMAPVGRAAVAPPQMRPPMMAGPPTGMMQGNINTHPNAFQLKNNKKCSIFFYSPQECHQWDEALVQCHHK